MYKSRLYRLAFLTCCFTFLSYGCGKTTVDSTVLKPHASAPSKTPSPNTITKSKQPDNQNLPSTTNRVYQSPDGTPMMRKAGLKVSSIAPTTGPEGVAWDFFKLQGEGKYEEALNLLTGFEHDEIGQEPGQKRLREIVSAQFVRWTDLTPVMSREKETLGAYDWRVIYLEANIKVRGAVPESYSGVHNGLMHFAVHLIQAKQGAPWKIVLVGGSPKLED